MALAAAAPSAGQAPALAASGKWDELYLAFAAAKPAQYSADERGAIGAALLSGCRALSRTDAVMASTLGELAAAFAPSPEATLCHARAAIASDQRSSAEDGLRTALARTPRHSGLLLALGALLLEEKDTAGAREILAQVSPKSRERREARALLARADALLRSDGAAALRARELERRAQSAQEQASRRTSLTYESGTAPGGMRTRANARFRFKYFSADRDFGQRADYEGSVTQALEDAYFASKRLLGVAREKPVDVVLYSAEEFALHHGSDVAKSVAGFYSGGAIRMNDAAEMTAQARATLVHEYVHAVVDELAGERADRIPLWLNEGLAEYTEWRAQGHDGPPFAIDRSLRGLATTGRLPSLRDMADPSDPLAGQADAPVRYGLAASAVKLLVARGGMPKLLSLIRQVGGGGSFESELERAFGQTVSRLDQSLVDELKR